MVHGFRSEKWGELYARRVDEMIGVLKAKGVPVFWVGLPPVRGARATSEVVYLNDIYRGRAEKAGIVYIDVWDGFVDDAGNFNNYGADFEGQTRRLRTGDGLHFTRAGARKLAHYLEREVRRVMLARATPLATPAPQEPEPEAKEPPAAAAPGLPPRPIASPVMSLTAPRGAGDTLLGGAQSRNAGADSVATRVLVKGEAIEAPAGRADDFAWPRRDIVTATSVLPPDPVEPPPKVEPVVAAAPGAPATAAPAKQAAAPRRERRAGGLPDGTLGVARPGGWPDLGRPDLGAAATTATAARLRTAPALEPAVVFRRMVRTLDADSPRRARQLCLAARFGRTRRQSLVILISRQNCRVSNRASIPATLVVTMASCAPMVSASKPT